MDNSFLPLLHFLATMPQSEQWMEPNSRYRVCVVVESPYIGFTSSYSFHRPNRVQIERSNVYKIESYYPPLERV
jgi:hypothetical protein